MQDHHPEQHGDQGVYEIADGRINRVVGEHGVDVGGPVDPNQQATHQQPPHITFGEPTKLTQSPPRPQPDQAANKAEHCPIGDHLKGVGWLQVVEVQREQTPKEVGQDNKGQGFTINRLHGRRIPARSQFDRFYSHPRRRRIPLGPCTSHYKNRCRRALWFGYLTLMVLPST